MAFWRLTFGARDISPSCDISRLFLSALTLAGGHGEINVSCLVHQFEIQSSLRQHEGTTRTVMWYMPRDSRVVFPYARPCGIIVSVQWLVRDPFPRTISSIHSRSQSPMRLPLAGDSRFFLRFFAPSLVTRSRDVLHNSIYFL